MRRTSSCFLVDSSQNTPFYFFALLYLNHRKVHKQTKKENDMAKKQTIYIVSKETNKVLRASKTFLAAIEFAATLPINTCYACTSEFKLKKGQVMSNISDFLEV